jgi:hypothetical protein
MANGVAVDAKLLGNPTGTQSIAVELADSGEVFHGTHS